MSFSRCFLWKPVVFMCCELKPVDSRASSSCYNEYVEGVYMHILRWYNKSISISLICDSYFKLKRTRHVVVAAIYELSPD